jgi:D-arabinose 1-dehydrogenase-like Zn-dependent alcohol dehydrogenase
VLISESQLKVKACGVCGTDLHIHEGEFLAKVWPGAPWL